jgi:Glycosyltransferases involved in cell wall biogenesis
MNPRPDSDLSVVIPTFNRLAFLRQAVESALRQTLLPREILIVDDGSTDGSWEWLQTQRSGKIHPFQTAQSGPAAARNFGAARAVGKYLAFLDSDDLWEPRKTALQLEFMEKHPEFRLTQTEEVWIRDGIRVNAHKKHQKPSGWVFEKCLPLCVISPSAAMMERQFFQELGGFDPSLPVCEDYDLWLRASLRSPVQTLAPQLVVKRGGHGDQLSKKFPAMDQFRVQSLCKILESEALAAAQRQALLAELEKKLGILSKGFEKRYPQESNPYREKLQWLQKNHLPVAS